MGSETSYSVGASEMEVSQEPSVYRHTRISRKAMPWYLASLFVNLTLVFSISHILVGTDRDGSDSFKPFSKWLMFAVIALCSPTFVSLSQILPDMSISLAAGGAMTTAGLMWSSLSSTQIQMTPLCALLVGAGISLSFQATCISLSPYFIRQTRNVSCVLLVVTAILMGNTCTMLSHCSTPTVFTLCLGPAVLLSSLLPLGHYLYTIWETCTDRKASPLQVTDPDMENALFISGDLASGEYELCDNETEEDGAEDSGLSVSFAVALVWLSWGACIDTTWMAQGWQVEYFDSVSDVPALQLFISLILLSVKCGAMYNSSSWTNWRINLASNYMQLGLLGACGMVFSIAFDQQELPIFPSHLLFTLGLTLQYDDLNDLYPVQLPSPPISVNYYKLMSFDRKFCPQKCWNRKSLLLVTCTQICHILALLLTALMAMILGIQATNLLGLLATVPPLSFICTRVGLFVVSTVAVVLSIARPDSWIGKRQHFVI